MYFFSGIIYKLTLTGVSTLGLKCVYQKSVDFKMHIWKILNNFPPPRKGFAT